MIKITIICLISIVLLFSCKSEKQRKMEDAAQKMEEAAEEMAKAAEEMGEHFSDAVDEAMEENADNLADAMEDLKESLELDSKVAVVDHSQLKNILPQSFAGLERKKQRSEKEKAMGIAISMAEALYFNDSGKEEIKLEITDMGNISGFLRMGAASWALKDIDNETSSGFERTTEINGYKAFEEYDRRDKRGKINVIVAKRFMVQAKCRDMSFGDLKDAMEDFNFDRLVYLAEKSVRN